MDDFERKNFGSKKIYLEKDKKNVMDTIWIRGLHPFL